ncbi:MAG: TldD/PmbA family protein [Conexivisphaerales archaeon]
MSIEKSTEEKIDELLDWISGKCRQLNVETFDILGYSSIVGQVRFSNNSITTVNYVANTESMLYMTKAKKRIMGLITSTERDAVEKLVERLYTSMVNGSPDSEFAPLPKGPFSYVNLVTSDEVLQLESSDLASRAIDAAVTAGAKRVAGSLQGAVERIRLLTSSGVDASDTKSEYTLNVRAFVEKDASGHGIAVSPRLKGLDVEAAGRTAGENAKKAVSPKQVEQGKYTVLIGRTVFANLTEAVGYSSSAFSIESGLSFLPEKLGEEAASSSFSLVDHGQIEGGVGSRRFDDEGLPTRKNTIIDRGIMKTHLHNSTTAMRWKTTSTANAGLIEPHPWNLEVSAGDSSLDEMIKETKRGIYITNNWYTRYQNHKLGEYSTLPRDYAAYIENGEIKYPVAGFRVSDAIPRQLKSLRLIGKERSWVKWWEVHTPVLCPDVLVDEVTITRAT